MKFACARYEPNLPEMPITTPKVPDGLPELMRGLAKSVIKENPDNIYVHAAEYFDNLVRERDGELNKDYKHFSAYRDYSDYKEKSRVKGSGGSGGEGVSAEPAVDSAPVKGGDGEDDDSGGSASTTRSKRRKRVKKQGSKDSSKSVEKENVPGSAGSVRSNGAAKIVSPKDSLDESNPSPEKDVEQVIVKMQAHSEYQIPPDKSVGKMLSIDSEVAANTVSSVLQDTVLESDEADRETGELIDNPTPEEFMKNLQQPINCEDLSSYPPDENKEDLSGNDAEDFGTAPSTAEVVENASEVVQEGSNEDGKSNDSPKNSDEVDLSVKEDTDLSEKQEDSPVNGSADKDLMVSEGQQEAKDGSNIGTDTVDAEGNSEDIIQPRFGIDEEEPLDMPNVPSEEPGAENEPVATVEDAQPESEAGELPTTPSEENNAGDKATENEEAVESPKEQSQEKDTQDDREKTSKDSTDKVASMEEIKNEVQEKRTPSSSANRSKSASMDKSASIDGTNGVTHGSEDAAALVTTPKETESNESAGEVIEPQEGLSTNEEKINSKEESVKQNSEDKTEGSIEKASEEVVEQPKEEETSEMKENIPTEEVSSKHSSRAVSAETPENGKSSEEQVSGEEPTPANDEMQNEADVESPKKSPASEASSVEKQRTGSAKDSSQEENANNESNRESPIEIAPSTAEEEPQKSDADEQPNPPLQSAGSRSKRSVGSAEEMEELKSNGSVESPKNPSLEKTESELNQSPEQTDPASKESSAKELEGDTSVGAASAEAEVPEKADDVLISSRMGDDENGDELGVNHSGSADGVDVEPENAEAPEPSAPPPDSPAKDNGEAKPDSAEELTVSPKVDDSSDEKEDKSTSNLANNSGDDLKNEDEDSNEQKQEDPSEKSESKEEAIEEPCVQRQVSPSASKPPSKVHSTDLEDIKKVDLTSLNKDSAEALFYSLKKSELEIQESPPEKSDQKADKEKEEDDDADVVVAEEDPPLPTANSRPETKRTFTDDFLEKGPITEEAPEQAEGDGVANDTSNVEAFNPIKQGTARTLQMQDQIHSREEPTQPKAPIRRSMTEWLDLSTQDTDYVDPQSYDPDFVEDEDQFDGYYIGNIRNKILASSVSVADSDYYDPEKAEERIDDNNVRTALETIASTDTESTLASQTTIQASKGFLRKGSQSTNIPYASFGNNAINQSLDDFIEREEQSKEQAASTIQRSYRRFRTNKRKLLRDYHSTMRTFTEDQSSDSFDDFEPNGIIKVKMDQKRPAESDDSFENIRMENRRRPMYSLNIDEYDTATRRTTLVRGVAMQRNSTAEDDSGKSNNASGDKQPVSAAIAEESPVSLSDISDEKKSSTSGDEKENKDNSSSRSS